MVGKVHCRLGTRTYCKPGPDYFIPSKQSALTKDEVISYTSMIAIFRSSWWPSGALTEMDDFTLSLLTNDDVIRVTMMSNRNRQVPTSTSTPSDWEGPYVVWTADDSSEDWKYVLLVNMCPCSAGIKCSPACATASESSVDVDFLQLGLTPDTTCDVTDLWTRDSLGKATSKLHASLRPHASLFVRLTGCHSPAHSIISVI